MSQKPRNCLSMIDHFVGLALNGLKAWEEHYFCVMWNKVFKIQLKGMSLQQIYYKRCQDIAVTSMHSLLFLTLKNKDLE